MDTVCTFIESVAAIVNGWPLIVFVVFVSLVTILDGSEIPKPVQTSPVSSANNRI